MYKTKRKHDELKTLYNSSYRKPWGERSGRTRNRERERWVGLDRVVRFRCVLLSVAGKRQLCLHPPFPTAEEKHEVMSLLFSIINTHKRCEVRRESHKDTSFRFHKTSCWLWNRHLSTLITVYSYPMMQMYNDAVNSDLFSGWDELYNISDKILFYCLNLHLRARMTPALSKTNRLSFTVNMRCIKLLIEIEYLVEK